MGYLRFQPGPSIQRLTFYAWDTGLTRYFNERLGITVDGRGYYGTAYVGLNPYSQRIHPPRHQPIRRHGRTHVPLLSAAQVLRRRPRHGGLCLRQLLRRHQRLRRQHSSASIPTASTFAASASVIGEVNLTPNVGFRLAPEYFFTGFGSTMQDSRGFTGGIVYRFGKQ